MKSPSLQIVHSMLTRSMRSTGDTGNISGTLQRICEAAQAGFGADICVIAPINPITDRNVLDTTYSLLLAVYPLQGHSFDVFVNEGEQIITINNKDLRDGACQYAAETRKPILINHFSQEENNLKFRIHTVNGTRPKEFYIFLSLVLRDDTFGVLSIQHERPYAYNERSLPALQLLANYVALALRNISLYNNLKRLNTTGQFLTELLDSEQASQIVVEQIREDARSEIAVLYPFTGVSLREVGHVSPPKWPRHVDSLPTCDKYCPPESSPC